MFMKKVIVCIALAVMSSVGMATNLKKGVKSKEKVFYLQNETKLCVVLDFKNAKNQ